MSKKIVDTNALSSSELRLFLSAAKQNKVVLCPPLFMELAKAFGKTDPANDLSVVRDFPDQIVVTQEMADIYRARGTAREMAARIENKSLTRIYIRALKSLPVKESDPQTAASELQIWAANLARRSHAEIAATSASLQSTHVKLLHGISEKDRRAFKNDQPCSEEFWKLFVDRCNELALAYIAQRDDPGVDTSALAFPNTYAFRLSVMANCYFLDWMRYGSPIDSQPAKVANDIVDLRIGAIATFYDGLITNDQKLTRVFSLARWALNGTH